MWIVTLALGLFIIYTIVPTPVKGADTSGVKLEDAGVVLANTLREYMQAMGVVDGLQEMGYDTSDVPNLVKGTLPQRRVTKLSPRSFTEEQLAGIFEDSMSVY